MADLGEFRVRYDAPVRQAPSASSTLFHTAHAGKIVKQMGRAVNIPGVGPRVPLVPRGWIDADALEPLDGASIGDPRPPATSSSSSAPASTSSKPKAPEASQTLPLSQKAVPTAKAVVAGIPAPKASGAGPGSGPGETSGKGKGKGGNNKITGTAGAAGSGQGGSNKISKTAGAAGSGPVAPGIMPVGLVPAGSSEIALKFQQKQPDIRSNEPDRAVTLKTSNKAAPNAKATLSAKEASSDKAGNKEKTKKGKQPLPQLPKFVIERDEEGNSREMTVQERQALMVVLSDMMKLQQMPASPMVAEGMGRLKTRMEQLIQKLPKQHQAQLIEQMRQTMMMDYQRRLQEKQLREQQEQLLQLQQLQQYQQMQQMQEMQQRMMMQRQAEMSLEWEDAPEYTPEWWTGQDQTGWEHVKVSAAAAAAAADAPSASTAAAAAAQPGLADSRATARGLAEAAKAAIVASGSSAVSKDSDIIGGGALFSGTVCGSLVAGSADSTLECHEALAIFGTKDLRIATSLLPSWAQVGTPVCFTISVAQGLTKPEVVKDSIVRPTDAPENGRFVGTLTTFSKKDEFAEKVGWLSCLATRVRFQSYVYAHATIIESYRVGDAISFEVHVNARGQPQASQGSIARLGLGAPAAANIGKGPKGSGKGKRVAMDTTKSAPGRVVPLFSMDEDDEDGDEDGESDDEKVLDDLEAIEANLARCLEGLGGTDGGS
eukprot:TRINITY_DN7449_c3_g1_i1.p1 TRINITY_DN7449_c3_g1~~TRINITY_DN7449_c3_g1_i1.p1  ORF type:complete len:739 (+),score=186.10 TRINITY_DN7449_c3_g1_i1:76-2217(+)